MLTVYRSNRTEFLATLLAQTLTLDPPGPFEELEIVVNTWPTSRWLGEQLAKANGISALVRFPFPGSRLRQLVRCILDLDPTSEDPWRAERLVWSVLNVLPSLLDHPTAESLKLWWEQHASVSGRLNRDHWQLARCLADAVDDYALYRPQELSQWIEGHGDADLPAQLQWQPQLVRALAALLPCDPFGLQVQKAIQRLRAGDVSAAALPPQLRLFGISNLAPVQIELLQGLSGLMAIELYLLTPCPELWQRSEQRRQTLGQAWNTPPDGPWLLESPRLEAILGRMGAEFQLLLEGNGDCFLGQWDQGDLFAAPIQIAASEQRPATLLEQVQQQLVDGSAPSLNPVDQDNSLRFLACAGPWREVQLVRDQILQWLASDSSLEPRDVLVMTPDVERYAPLLSSVFGDHDATGISIPWRLTDRSQQSSPGLSQGFMALLKLASERFTASGLEALLANPALQVLQGITAADAVRITQCLQQTGFRWGVDGKERGGDDTHSLSWCLDRWLLGLVLPEEPGLAPGGCAPFQGGLTIQQLEQWWPLLDGLAQWIIRLRQPHSPSAWTTQLNQLLQHLYGDGGDWAWEQQAIVEALDRMQQQASECTLDLDLSVVVSILDEALSADSGRFGHRSGALTISALEPMRAIPHRLIVLMGLDSQSFPRQRERPGFHLLEQQRRLGDPSSTDQDRYVLLEALMSARQHLLISWNARDERKGEELPPSPPVQQWLTLLNEQLTPEQFERVVLEQPANPLDARNFLVNRAGSAFSCDRHHLEARLNLDRRDYQRSSNSALGLAHPLSWTAGAPSEGFDSDTINRWLEAPQRYWLKARGLETREWSTPVEDLSALELEERERQSLLNQSFLDQLDWLATDSSLIWDHALPGEWSTQLRGQGMLPPGAAGQLAANRLEQRWQNLQLTLLRLGPLHCDLIRSETESRSVLRAGTTTVLVSAGRLQSRTALGGWFTHLIQQAAGVSTPTAVISRCDSSTKADHFQLALHWQPLDADRAKELLLSLHTLAAAGAESCWPVPPASGLARALMWHKGLDKANRAFESRWDGGFAGMGERARAEMQLCFGDHFEADDFLTAACFEEAFQALYAPMLEAQRP